LLAFETFALVRQVRWFDRYATGIVDLLNNASVDTHDALRVVGCDRRFSVKLDHDVEHRLPDFLSRLLYRGVLRDVAVEANRNGPINKK